MNENAETNINSILNNDKGIPVTVHKEHNCYVPTLIFGHLLRGCNFDGTKKKTTGGRNGFGTKLANIFNVEFVVKCLNAVPQVCVQRGFHDLFNLLAFVTFFPIKLVGKGRVGASVAATTDEATGQLR